MSILKISKGNNSAKNVGGETVLISARHLVMLYISTKFCEIILNGIKVIEPKNVGGVNVVNLCTSPGHALYLCQVS